MKKISFYVLIICLLAACQGNEIFKEYQDIAQLQWNKTQSISFEADVQDTTSAVDWVVSLRHTSSMTQGDIKILLESVSPSGKTASQEYILNIRNRQTGELLGSAMGDMCDTDNTIESQLVFKESGKYKFKITHLNEDVLPVLEVGFILRKAK